jgi:pimeloyl-ACP methyl ester carboxylesterase
MSTPLRLQLLRRVVAFTERSAPALTDRLLRKLFLTPPRHPRKSSEKVFLSKATSFELSFGAQSLAAWSLGSGPTVLLMHGWGGRGGQWRFMAQDLVESGFRAVWFDAPAHGDSAGSRSSLLEFAGALCAAEAQLGPLHAVVGHSLGGAAIALAMAKGLRPHRVVLVAAPAHPQRFYRSLMRLLEIPEAAWADHERAFEVHLGLPWSIAEVPRHLAEHPCPALIIHDLDDAEVPFREAQDLEAAGPHVQLHPTARLGHRRIIRNPEVLQTITTFLGGQPACGPAALESLLMDRQSRPSTV